MRGTAIRLFSGFTLFSCLAGVVAPTWAQTSATRSNPESVLTEDVLTRVLGFEKGELEILEIPLNVANDPNRKSNADRIRQLRKLIAEAVIAFQAGNGDAALAKFEDALKIDESLPPADVYLARLCFAVNNPNFVQLGRNMLNRAADKHPEAPEPYMMLANLALAEGRITDAYVLFEKAGSLLQGPFAKWSAEKLTAYKKNVFSGRVSVCEQRQNWDQGLAEVQSWLVLDPKDPVAIFREGRLIFMKNPKDAATVSEARKRFEEAYRIALANQKDKNELPAVPPAELALLELQTANGNPEKAREEIAMLDGRSLEWEQNRREGSRVYSTISQWYLGQGEFKTAEDYAAKATALDKDSKALKQLTAVLHYFAGEAEAEAEFTAMNQEAPDDFFASNFLALVLSDAKTANGKADDAKRAKAVRIAEINARLNPRSPVAVSTLGWAYFNAGRVAEAAQLYATLEQQQNLQVGPDTAYYMAKTFAALPTAQYPSALNRSKALLELAVQSTGTFRYRKEAETWLTALGGTIPARSESSNTSTTTLAPGKVTLPGGETTKP